MGTVLGSLSVHDDVVFGYVFPRPERMPLVVVVVVVVWQ